MNAGRLTLFIGLILLSLKPFTASAQDKGYAKYIIDTLTSRYFAGRGYIEEGDKKAAEFIASQYERIGVKGFEQLAGYFQSFTLGVNVFPGAMHLDLDGEMLQPGADFLVAPESDGLKKCSLPLLMLDSAETQKLLSGDFKKRKARKHALLIHQNWLNKKNLGEIEALKKLDPAFLIITQKKPLVWSVGRVTYDFPVIYAAENINCAENSKVNAAIDQEYIQDYASQNVIGYVKGRTQPDSFIIISAHYDHLGMMGNEAWFPGANDNASGIAIMLDLAKYYVQNPPAYSIVFIGFGAEEAGLVGSKLLFNELGRKYVPHPNSPFDLDKVSFMINLDLMANGQDGMMVVNGEGLPWHFSKLKEINDKNSYLKEIKKRPNAANSDHFWFVNGGGKAFFFYLQGHYPYYHDIYDTAEKPTLAGYEGAFRLIRDFISAIQHPVN